MARSFRIGDWLVEPDHNRLVRGENEVKIDFKPMQVLVHLAENADDIVLKENLIETVWEGLFVTDEVLTNAIWEIRRALGDDAKNPEYIQTIPRKGYRLIAPVSGEVVRCRQVAEVTIDKTPYPGLSPFSERDAEFFFGREEEVETVWKKLKSLHLLALIGPSGAGKTSFLRAGLMPSRPEGWRVVMCHPGDKPFVSLGQALVPEFGNDTGATQELFRMDALDIALPLLKRWREAHQEVLLILDPFEELFTLSPEDVQPRFAELLGCAASEAGVRVLLSMRDDFLIYCHDHPSLDSVFEKLTPIKPLAGRALCQALVAPAERLGYRFEDDSLVAEMLAEVAKERGALPLLSFAAARLWSKRDREKRILTREAYFEIGGVGGAIARHAETTLAQIGVEHHRVVREIFRNLVTARGTRVARDKEELLTVFEDRETARAVLHQLINARLLTSFEKPMTAEESEQGRQVEVIHESLLSAWPRLVRWQAQEAEGAVLRDQLRQAAQLWQDRGRPVDLLWTGTSLKEYQLWRERYPGQLTTTEDSFATAMLQNAERRKKLRRLAAGAVVASLLAVIAVVATLWRQSETSRQEAVLEAKRREAGELLARGRLRLEDDPTAALAHTIASLERADNPEGRRFALEALWRGPTAFVLPEGRFVIGVAFSPDGRWLAEASLVGARLWPRAGGPPHPLTAPDALHDLLPSQVHSTRLAFGPESDLLVEGAETLRVWSLPDAKEIRHIELESASRFLVRQSRLLTFAPAPLLPFVRAPAEERTVRSWSLDGEASRVLARWGAEDVTSQGFDVDVTGEVIAYGREGGVYIAPLDVKKTRPRLVGRHPANVWKVSYHPASDRLVASDEAGGIHFWPLSSSSPAPERTFPKMKTTTGIDFDLDASGTLLAAAAAGPHSTGEVAWVWDLEGPPDADPLVLRGGRTWLHTLAVHPDGSWVAIANDSDGVVWPLIWRHAKVFRGQSPPFIVVAFTANGNELVSSSDDGAVRLWPLSSATGERSRVLFQDKTALLGVWSAVDPAGRYLLTVDRFGRRVFLVPLSGGEARLVPGIDIDPSGYNVVGPVAFSRDGRLAAIASYPPAAIRIWDIRSGRIRTLDTKLGDEDCGGTEHAGEVDSLAFTREGRLVSDVGGSGLLLWNLEDGSKRLLRPCRPEMPKMRLVAERQYVLVAEGGQEETALSWIDLEDGSAREITSHGNQVSAVALDPTGTIVVTGDSDGIVRVGPVTGEEPHLLFGHGLDISSVAVSPDGRSIASGSQDGTIRLWPMPDLSEPPLHTLPHEVLLDRLRSLTNMRVVADEAASGGYRLEAGRFPGWENVPEW